ncbi:S8 family serine peptidase [bacterium]|nr:S8 family serine peptidase [bacterium]
MKRTLKRVLSLFMLITLGFCCLVGCSSKNDASLVATDDVHGNNELVEVLSTSSKKPDGQFNKGVVLVKTNCFDASMFGELKYESVEQLYKNSLWYEVELSDKDATEDAVSYLLELDTFDKVDYDYIMGSDGTIESIDVSANPYSTEQGYLDAQGIFDGWGYAKAENKTVGGSPDVVVAIIDTGVDYNHLDLRNNIWTNSGEIPNNGVDDDGNGYVDDYYGWDCVGNDNDPMDDNGHGTHVAGIVAAENNAFGTVGVAFNCKVMCIKAGNSTGYFNNSDIAEAIQYAYMNGASVINMSFGGSNISTAVKDALEDAYNQCVLVAAAGNDSLCNNLAHYPYHPVGVSYPAALPYVLGVMSTNSTGTVISAFSNYDDTPYDSVEYEVYACGEQVPSTWPNNKVARLSGTSMACPVVSGIAALLRSNYSDREVYSNKFIQSQIVNTGSINPFGDSCHSIANVYEALTKMPKPSVSLYDYYIFDSDEFSIKNNNNGVIDAGETIRLAIELRNRGGVASNVVATIGTTRNNDPSLTDPYFAIQKGSINLPNIGTYSVIDCDLIYDDGGNPVNSVLYFEFVVADNCPNDYLANFNVNFTYKNGMDEQDVSSYSSKGVAQLTIYSGRVLPTVLTSDTTLTPDTLYILKQNMIINEGVTLTIQPGVTIQYYASSHEKYTTVPEYLRIVNNGTIVCEGTEDNHIVFKPSELYSGYCIDFNGNANFKYCEFYNMCFDQNNTWSRQRIGTISLDHCYVSDNSQMAGYGFFCNTFGEVKNTEFYSINRYSIEAESFENCLFREWAVGDNYSWGGDRYRGLKARRFEGNVFYDTYPYWLENGQPGVGHYINICDSESDTVFDNNALLFNTSITDIKYSFRIQTTSMYSSKPVLYLKNNYITIPMEVINQNTLDYTNDGVSSILDFDTNSSNYSFDNSFPFVSSIEIKDEDGNQVNKVGSGEYTIGLTFLTPMNIEKELSVYYGSVYPYSDYTVMGSFKNEYLWEGTINVKAFYEGGQQYLTINGSANVNDSYKAIKHDRTNSFVIDLNNALSMNLQAYASNTGINLEWTQDDYDTLMGYNVYRSTEKDGYFTKLNSAVIPAGENTFVDENAEPGVTYWYTFTVVFSDMTESAPAGKVSCTAADTIAPSIYHTPVNQGYLSNNLVISCTASDNIGIASVTLYYKTKGAETWKTLSMSKQNDRYSATVFGSDLSLEGLEYYIVASDGYNTINKGTAENPYSVIVKDASSISRLGDVDGDGVITTKDALMIMQSINGDLLLTDDQFKRADLNNDGVLSSVEALRILQYINGNVSTLEM